MLWKGRERNGTGWEEVLWQFIDDSSTLLSARRTHMGEQILSCGARKIGDVVVRREIIGEEELGEEVWLGGREEGREGWGGLWDKYEG